MPIRDSSVTEFQTRRRQNGSYIPKNFVRSVIKFRTGGTLELKEKRVKEQYNEKKLMKKVGRLGKYQY
jgi:hypothetical protein